MKSRIMEQNQREVIELNRQLSPEERLEAFYHHSRLLTALSLCRKPKEKLSK